MNELVRAMDYINEYCQREFDDNADFSDLSKVGLAYTTFGDNEEHDIQVDADLNQCAIITLIDGEEVERTTYLDLEEMNSYCLAWLEFDDLISPMYDYIEEE